MTQEAYLRELVLDLCKGIEEWAQDEDGIHPECYPSYHAAREFIGFEQSPGEDKNESEKTTD